MRNSRHLLNPFQDADDLLSRELEDVAKHLLDYLDGSEEILPSAIISEELLFLEPEIEQKFPSPRRKEILFALMEAWHWLCRKGFIAPRPKFEREITVNPQYFVTRKGRSSIPSDTP